MNFEKLKEYLRNKQTRKRLEEMALQAIIDNEFMSEYDNFNYFVHMSQLRNVLNNPAGHDTTDVNNKSLYIMTLKEISSTYGTYLRDEKSSYSKLKKEVLSLEDRIKNANDNISKIDEVSKVISGAKVLDSYAEEFKKRSDRYEEEAGKWKSYLSWSFGLFGFIFLSFILFSIINLDNFKNFRYISEEIIKFGYVSAVIIKIIILVALVQLIRFFNRNYNANKHLASQSLHKYDVLRSLQGIYNTIDIENQKARDELIKTGALTAFQNIESGYITTKEGAGSSDAGAISILSDLLKK